jgi:hypothetical protein
MRILIALLALLLVACGNNAVAPDAAGVPLAFGLVSFSSKADVLDTFAKGHRTELIEDSSLGPNDARPPYSVYTIEVLGIAHSGKPGRVLLSFFNDRLMGVWFYPDNVSAYRAAMQAGNDVDRHVVSWAAEDYRGHWYVAWEDKRLRDAMDDWIQRYS